MLHAALAAELEAHGAALYLNVAIAQGGQPIGLVVAQVALVADADQRVVEQAHHQRHDFLSIKARAGQVHLQLRAQFWQGLGKGQHAPVLVLVTQFAPLGVVAVLLATASVAAGGLQVALRVAANPHIGVGRRDHQRGDARQGFAVAHALPLGVEVDEAVAPATPGQARLAVVDIVQAGWQRAVEHRRQASIRSLINGQQPLR